MPADDHIDRAIFDDHGALYHVVDEHDVDHPFRAFYLCDDDDCRRTDHHLDLTVDVWASQLRAAQLSGANNALAQLNHLAPATDHVRVDGPAAGAVSDPGPVPPGGG